MSVSTRGSFQAKVEAEHRDGICETCGERMATTGGIAPGQKEYITLPFNDLYPGIPNQVIALDKPTGEKIACPKCGGTKGRLIARSVSIQSPSPSECSKPSCLWKFFWDTVYSSLLSNYHHRRVRYAERKRHKKIPIKYRTGEDAPKNIRQAILAIIKLKLRR